MTVRLPKNMSAAGCKRITDRPVGRIGPEVSAGAELPNLSSPDVTIEIGVEADLRPAKP